MDNYDLTPSRLKGKTFETQTWEGLWWVVFRQRPIRDAARAVTRMVGRASGRYRNVGFRCVRMLWSPAKK